MSDQPLSSESPGYVGNNPLPAGELPPKVYILLIKSRFRIRRRRRQQPWRWVAVRAGNRRRLATSGEWYTNRGDALDAIQTLFGYGTDVYLHPSVSPLGDVLIRGAR